MLCIHRNYNDNCSIKHFRLLNKKDDSKPAARQPEGAARGAGAATPQQGEEAATSHKCKEMQGNEQ